RVAALPSPTSGLGHLRLPTRLSEQEIATSEMGSQGSSCDAGGALAFILWVLALQRATPTRVANTMTVNPIAAGLLATQLVGEPITPNLVLGLLAVFAEICMATSEVRKPLKA